MGISLDKGELVNLSKESPGLRRVRVGLGWDVREGDGVEFDLDASAFLLNNGDQVRMDQDFVFYNNLASQEGSVTHTGDNRTGEGEGDDEVIMLNLEKVPFDVSKIAFTVTIHDADERSQNFGLVENAFMRIVNDETGDEIARYELADAVPDHTGMVFGEMVRDGSDWEFRAIGSGVPGGLYELAKDYGVNVA